MRDWEREREKEKGRKRGGGDSHKERKTIAV